MSTLLHNGRVLARINQQAMDDAAETFGAAHTDGAPNSVAVEQAVWAAYPEIVAGALMEAAGALEVAGHVGDAPEVVRQLAFAVRRTFAEAVTS
ncbi:MAG: hypothetical protein ACRCZP_14490 [Phycicoccus sp.]